MYCAVTARLICIFAFGYVTSKFSDDAAHILSFQGLDVGDESIREFTAAIGRAKTIVWNG